jgi:putative methionine-R-sulfoxide reductase with GAF domain
MERRAQRGFRAFLTAQRLVEWAAIIAGFVTARLLARPTSWLGWLLLVLAGILVATPVILASFREHLRAQEAASAVDLATEYRTKLTVTLGDALTPLADLLGRINLASTDHKPALQAQLRQGAVDAVAALCGKERTRATFFVLQDAELVPEAWAGRAEAPPAQSLMAKDRSSKVFRDLVQRHGRLLVADVGDRQAPIRFGSFGGSRAVIMATVHAGNKEFGVLTADSPEPSALEAADLDLLATVAQLLGAGLAATPDRSPKGDTKAKQD